MFGSKTASNETRNVINISIELTMAEVSGHWPKRMRCATLVVAGSARFSRSETRAKARMRPPEATKRKFAARKTSISLFGMVEAMGKLCLAGAC